MATITTTDFGKSQTKKGLLILDIQDDFTGEKARMPVDTVQANEMIENLNNLLTKIDTSAFEIIYICNEFSRWDFLNIFRNFAAIKGTRGTKIDSRIKVISDNYFPKNRENAFTNPALDAYLKSKSINEFYITGLKAEACVYSTIKGGIKLGYRVNVLTDCIATTSNKKRDKMLERYSLFNVSNLTSKSLLNQYSKQ